MMQRITAFLKRRWFLIGAVWFVLLAFGVEYWTGPNWAVLVVLFGGFALIHQLTKEN